jgi:hypothetical protein
MKNEWIPYTEIDFSDKTNVLFSIDTRDFHCIGIKESDKARKPDPWQIHRANNKPNEFYHTEEELKSLIDRYFTESGGKGEWRMFMLDGIGKSKTDNWQMKYIRIFNLSKGFLIAIADDKDRENTVILDKKTLSSPVHQEHLNHH